MNVESRVRKMEGHAGNLLDGYRVLRQEFAVLEPILPATTLSRKLSSGSGFSGDGLAVLRNVLFLWCALGVVKLCLDKDKSTPSILNLIHDLDDDAVIKDLRGRASRYVLPRKSTDEGIEDALKKLEQNERTERAARFDERIHRLRCDWKAFEGRSVLTQFGCLRDKYVAHYELRLSNGEYAPIDIGGLGLKWSDLGEAIHTMESLIWSLNLAIRGDFDMEGAVAHFNRVRDDFWGPVSRCLPQTPELTSENPRNAPTVRG